MLSFVSNMSIPLYFIGIIKNTNKQSNLRGFYAKHEDAALRFKRLGLSDKIYKIYKIDFFKIPQEFDEFGSIHYLIKSRIRRVLNREFFIIEVDRSGDVENISQELYINQYKKTDPEFFAIIEIHMMEYNALQDGGE